jgi:PAS domain S-box-containing protein
MTSPIRLLLLEDNDRDAELAQRELRRGGLDFHALRVATQPAFTDALASFQPDLILADYRVPAFSGLDALALARERCPAAPFILISGTLPEDEATEALKLGATDFVSKLRLNRLPIVVQRALREVQEHRQIQQAVADLRQAEEKYRTIFEHASEGIFQTSPEGRFLTANPAMARILGYGSPEELIAERTDIGRQGYADPQRREEFKRLLAEHGSVRGFEYELLRKDGSRRWVCENARAVRDAAGQLVCYEGTLQDITERRQAEQALRESEEQSVKLFQASPAAICVTTLHEGRLVRVNEAFLRLTGYALPQVVHRTTLELNLWEHPVERSKFVERFRLERSIRNEEGRFRTANGRLRDALFSAELIELGGVPCILCLFQDITERKQAEAAWRESELLYHSLVENLPLEVFRKDCDGRFTFANRRFCELLGVTPGELLGRTDADFFPAELAAKYRHDDLQVIATRQPFEDVEEHRRSDVKKAKDLQVVKSPLFNSAGEVIGVQGLCLDITERRQLEQQLLQSQKMDAIGQLAGGVAHDFNNLLTVISGYAGLLLAQPAPGPEWSEYLKTIASAAERAANLTRQLLTFSRKQAIERRPLELNELVENLSKMLRRVIGEDIVLHCQYAPGLPLVEADAGMMEQVLMNLAVNARDAMPTGGRLTITTERLHLHAGDPELDAAAKPGTFVRLSVADTGCGIPREHLTKIFEPFFTTKDVGKGTGLGLATVFGIAQQHHGWIRVYTEVGHGTVFHLYLPAAAADATVAAEELVEAQVPGGAETILLVEDEAALRALVRNVLERHGYTVLDAPSGAAALVTPEPTAGRIDLLLTDVVMPDGVTGYELADALRARWPGLKVIYMSGYSVETLSRRSVLREGLNFLQKPFQPLQLLSAVRRRLDGGE